jgi:biotin-(acetyl-CoA carboxylase) ligase
LPGSVYEEWRDRLVTLGKRVSVRWGDAVYEGVAESVERDGCLFVRQADGNLVKIVAGDASLRG